MTAVLERLCDRVAIVPRGRCLRLLERAEWGGAGFEPTALERGVLAATGA